MTEKNKSVLWRAVGSTKRLIEQRKETNEELMNDSLLRTGKIKLRLVVMVFSKRKWWGYQGAQIKFEAKSIREVREIIANLKDSLEEKDGDTGSNDSTSKQRA